MRRQIYLTISREIKRSKPTFKRQLAVALFIPFLMLLLFIGKVFGYDENKNMTNKKISGGVVHEMPADLKKALISDAKALAAWENITPLARNEWICWVISVKTLETRHQHIKRTVAELKEGMRRPCCWMGCIHRKDKPLSSSQKYVLSKRTKN